MFSKAFYKIISSLFILFIFIFIYNQSQSVDNNMNNNIIYPIKVTVNDGETLPSIANKLYSDGVIKSVALFRIFTAWINMATAIRPGIYIFDRPMTLYETVKKFALRRPDKQSMSVTIPEGFTNEEIIDRVMYYLPNLNREKFLTLAKDKQGMLFPETYFLQNSMTEQSIIDLMYNQYLERTAILKTFNMPQSKNALILASILEGESKNGNEEMRTIAGILYNRLDKGIKLQVDVALETYKSVGLPKEPINNPGIVSIEAAMSPIATDYMFYLHDTNGDIHYAKTYEEHKKNIKKYLK